MGQGDDWRTLLVLSEDGARAKDVDKAETLAWHPCCWVMAPGSPNPLDEPWLRFPFTARQLTAFMTDGWGRFIEQKYRDWKDGPNDEGLLSISHPRGQAKEALRAAYAAHRRAITMAATGGWSQQRTKRPGNAVRAWQRLHALDAGQRRVQHQQVALPEHTPTQAHRVTHQR